MNVRVGGRLALEPRPAESDLDAACSRKSRSRSSPKLFDTAIRLLPESPGEQTPRAATGGLDDLANYNAPRSPSSSGPHV